MMLLVAGCGQAPSGAGAALQFDPCQSLAVVADADATSAQTDGIAAGIALWNQRASARLSIGAATDGRPALPLHFQQAAAPFHGFYDDTNGQVFINMDLVAHQQAVTIAHEIGHAFGLVHVPADQRPSLMNSGNLTVEPTPEDVETLAARWGRCPP